VASSPPSRFFKRAETSSTNIGDDLALGVERQGPGLTMAMDMYCGW
jgi:hypothetical protein